MVGLVWGESFTPYFVELVRCAVFALVVVRAFRQNDVHGEFGFRTRSVRNDRQIRFRLDLVTMSVVRDDENQCCWSSQFSPGGPQFISALRLCR